MASDKRWLALLRCLSTHAATQQPAATASEGWRRRPLRRRPSGGVRRAGAQPPPLQPEPVAAGCASGGGALFPLVAAVVVLVVPPRGGRRELLAGRLLLGCVGAGARLGGRAAGAPPRAVREKRDRDGIGVVEPKRHDHLAGTSGRDGSAGGCRGRGGRPVVAERGDRYDGRRGGPREGRGAAGRVGSRMGRALAGGGELPKADDVRLGGRGRGLPGRVHR